MNNNNNKSAAIKDDIFGIRLLTKPVIGPSGRFVFFLGHHYNGKEECFDVGAADMARRPIRITRRHHHTKADALITWSELQEKLKKMEEREDETAPEKKIVIGRS